MKTHERLALFLWLLVVVIVGLFSLISFHGTFVGFVMKENIHACTFCDNGTTIHLPIGIKEGARAFYLAKLIQRSVYL